MTSTESKNWRQEGSRSPHSRSSSKRRTASLPACSSNRSRGSASRSRSRKQEGSRSPHSRSSSKRRTASLPACSSNRSRGSASRSRSRKQKKPLSMRKVIACLRCPARIPLNPNNDNGDNNKTKQKTETQVRESLNELRTHLLRGVGADESTALPALAMIDEQTQHRMQSVALLRPAMTKLLHELPEAAPVIKLFCDEMLPLVERLATKEKAGANAMATADGGDSTCSLAALREAIEANGRSCKRLQELVAADADIDPSLFEAAQAKALDKSRGILSGLREHLARASSALSSLQANSAAMRSKEDEYKSRTQAELAELQQLEADLEASLRQTKERRESLLKERDVLGEAHSLLWREASSMAYRLQAACEGWRKRIKQCEEASDLIRNEFIKAIDAAQKRKEELARKLHEEREERTQLAQRLIREVEADADANRDALRLLEAEVSKTEQALKTFEKAKLHSMVSKKSQEVKELMEQIDCVRARLSYWSAVREALQAELSSQAGKEDASFVVSSLSSIEDARSNNNRSNNNAPEDDDLCTICLDGPKDTVLSPCGHQCCCGPCATKMNQCPICREQIVMRTRVYRS
eukprot:GEZU01026670.1.p1 GENE.GEZU01026670.1~~GEZU01026670.1.p1  ORF type:complete len:584 (-),score=138.27 GEZU01026670.1:173-1924(-)